MPRHRPKPTADAARSCLLPDREDRASGEAAEDAPERRGRGKDEKKKQQPGAVAARACELRAVVVFPRRRCKQLWRATARAELGGKAVQRGDWPEAKEAHGRHTVQKWRVRGMIGPASKQRAAQACTTGDRTCVPNNGSIGSVVAVLC
jgi:hypothetical protein